MSTQISPKTNKPYGIQLVCGVWDLCRSAYYARKKPHKEKPKKRGPKPVISDRELLGLIKEDLECSPFYGEGHRKVSARLHRSGKRVGRGRVLRLMRSHHLLSPHRSQPRTAKTHDRRITTDEPNKFW